MLPIERGLEIVMSVAKSRERPDRMPVESVPLRDSLRRILRDDVLSDADSPPFDKAIRDGFAVRVEDLDPIPVVLSVVGESRAGLAADVTVERGQCCEIMTGAPLPAGSNAVVMVENTERVSPNSVRILRGVRENEGLLRRGAEARQGELILRSGRRIGLADLGLLAGNGKSTVLVSAKPSVAVIATGDELVEVEETPKPDQIRNSNSYTICAQVEEAGARPTALGIARDDLDDLRRKICQGLEEDILIVSGGVSVGKYDLVEKVFAEFGVEVLFDKIAMKPGKPTVFGHRGQTYVFGLPGNPISTMVAFHMFVRPLILFLLKAENTAPKVLEAKLEAPAKCDPERAALVPALVRFDGGQYWIRPAPWKGSSDLVGLSRANALIMIPRRSGTLESGQNAQFLLME
ncbi:MAG: molybdopterin molybdenumtransferase MoeA [Acidobacteria bacterium]|nr:MAG: molybdopterin molybdenumtransferase MoeA [Acidobacteriota bacterium]